MSAAVPTAWAGIDTAKRSFDAAFVAPSFALAYEPAALRDIPVRTFSRTREGAEACAQWLQEVAREKEFGLRVVMEATGAYSTELVAWLMEAAPELAPAIANPKRTSDFIKSLGLRNKTDKLEARALGLYGLQRQPAPHEPLSPERAELRSLVRYRDRLVQERVAEKLNAAEYADSKKVRSIQKRRLEQFDRDIKAIEKEMENLVEKDENLHRDCERLETIYGVGFLTAAVILAEIGDLRRFTRARQLTAFAGVSPRLVQSGTSCNKSHLCKEGNGRVRQALYMAATTAVRGDNQLACQYRRLREQGKPHKPAIVAVMRKLLTVMRAVLIHEKEYQPYYKSCGENGGKPCDEAA